MAMLVDFFVNRSLGKLADFIEGEICKVLGVKEEIEKLRRRLARISPHLQAAEQRRHQDAAINVWVTELTDIMYDVEDIMDDCMLEGGQLLKPHLPSSSSSSSSSSKVVSFSFGLLSSCLACTKYRHEIANRIEEINLRLKEISEDSLITSRLAQHSRPSKIIRDHTIRYRETTPLEVKADIVGTQIEEAVEDLISNQILKNNEENKRCNVIGIVGMGGIGKSTLARKIMNDDRIAENFPIRIWLYVSKNYSKTGLLRNIVKGAREVDDEAEGIQELEAKVVSLLNKNFFIVLDDVWSTDVWNDLLRNPILNAVANRRKILVTSRDESVLSSMKASYTHHVRGMNGDDGWKLFRNIVFEDEDSKGYGLDDIGKELVKLCGGLPLAIKVTAGVLASKDKNRREWQNVLKSDSWKMNHMDAEIPKALYLSYEDLPSHLKECFLSCSLYNEISTTRDLLPLWVAEGLIAEKGRNILVEDVAEEYYKQLFRRNLLQLDPICGHDACYTMHDLLRSLGANLIREEGITMTDDQNLNTNPLTKIRRLSLSNKGNILALPNAIMKQKCLRSLHLYSSCQTKTIEVGLLEGLRKLRILNIRYTQIVSLPDSLFELVHLRYLNLDGTGIHEIPEAIGRLVNLQTLNMAECASLHRLPNSITELHNLRCLRLDASPLSHLPKGIGGLTNLNYISGFVIGHDKDASEGCDLGELQSFPKMRSLQIKRLERASLTGTTVLADKATFLRILCLVWTKQEGHGCGAAVAEEQIERAENICGELMPPTTIEDLRIWNFRGRRFLDWIMSTSASTSLRCLTHLRLWECSSCTELPPLGRLPQLKQLEICGARAIQTIGPEFLGCSSDAAPAAFPKLEFLIFKYMRNWEEWWLGEGEGDGDVKLLFPTLRECTLVGCSMLRALPDNLYRATNLKKIVVSSFDYYTRREYSRHRSILRLAYDPSEGPPDWATEFVKEEPKVAPSVSPKILFYLV